MLILIVIWLAFGIASSFVASNRGGSGCLFFALGCFFGPLTLLFAFFEGVVCPFCRSRIHAKAIICPRCQQNLVDIPPKEVKVVPLDEDKIRMSQGEISEQNQKTFKWLLRIFAILVVISAIIGVSLMRTDSSVDENTNDKKPESTVDASDSTWHDVDNFSIGTTKIRKGQLKSRIERIVGDPTSFSTEFIGEHERLTCKYYADEKHIEICYLRTPGTDSLVATRLRLDTPRSVESAPGTPVRDSDSAPRFTAWNGVRWRDYECLSIGGRTIRAGTNKRLIESVVGQPIETRHESINNFEISICRYYAGNMPIEIRYVREPGTDSLWGVKISARE